MSIAAAAPHARRAIGVVRVSQTNGREGDSFASPGEQADRIRSACSRDGLALVEIIQELDVSGGTALNRRAGLRRAVEAVEAGAADIVVASYFDRLVRSLRVQDELVSRVEAAGGQVLALDTGRVTNGSAGQWLSGTMLGAEAEYARRTSAERSGEAQARAVARGVLTYPNVPPGYVRGEDGVLQVDASTASAVAEAFAMRAAGADHADVLAPPTQIRHHRGLLLTQAAALAGGADGVDGDLGAVAGGCCARRSCCRRGGAWRCGPRSSSTSGSAVRGSG